MKYANTVLDTIGDTPLVRLNAVTEGIEATVLVKVEYFNPGGSSKDRIATRIIDDAEAKGLLKPGGTIVEPTSGNTGIGLALVAQQRGYRCIFVLPDKVGEDKRNVLLAYGAEIVVTPTAVAPESPESYYSVSDRLAREIPGAFKPDQYSNMNGPLSHYETTGPEIWRDTEGRITHFVAGVGTGGTISGVGKYLKEQNPGVVVIGADPEGSVYSGGTGRPYLVEGVGEDFWPSAYDGTVVDQIIASSDAESFDFTRRLAREEGLLVGGSSGLAVASGLKAARELGPDDVMVILLPDGGRGYLGKVFSDKWMRSYGFLPAEEDRTVADLVGTKDPDLAGLVHVHPSDTVRHTIDKMRRFDISQMPVLTAEPPVVMGEVVGSIDEKTLIDAVFSGRAQLTDALEEFVGPPLGLIGMQDSVEAVRDALAESDALLVTSDGKPAAVVTRHDLLAFLSA
ncbi:cystathionine beta-synthase [Microbacteriaceae bacterium SG_E_30_P1]|uniref:Cystathionine beta-synthase n=1 Tax=Antiquaquibacter oligotrophicus TaxID=2880260 RepID=A0ABT6KPL1_9MICO|nr:cystathionine beta-synthase [Antiquaquibacter oligotrophicus]MDH6181925.1 cystathionine beta-synthase [Antiquaquibacter oligotrophicus]UDF12404.1 cystathionine beta-synthase [Antiquaquibacter oligotrophicus]